MADAAVRRAERHEAETVRDVVCAAYRHYVARIGQPPGPIKDDYAARIRAQQAWVMADGDGISGVLVLEDGPDAFLLDNIAVRPDRQGSGVGRQLMDFAEAQACARGWDRITLYTNALMTENIAIYRKRGYVEVDRRQENGFDRVYMEKPLTGDEAPAAARSPAPAP